MQSPRAVNVLVMTTDKNLPLPPTTAIPLGSLGEDEVMLSSPICSQLVHKPGWRQAKCTRMDRVVSSGLVAGLPSDVYIRARPTVALHRVHVTWAYVSKICCGGKVVTRISGLDTCSDSIRNTGNPRSTWIVPILRRMTGKPLRAPSAPFTFVRCK